MEDKLLTVAQASKLAGVSVASIRSIPVKKINEL